MTTYTTEGFSVASNQGPWLYGPFNKGDVFSSATGANAYLESSVLVSEGGLPFTFSSLELANDVGNVEYEIQGFNGSQLLYAMSGALPTDPIGYAVLRSYGSGYSDTPITSLVIGGKLVDGAPWWGTYDDFTIDNIVVNTLQTTPVSETPEPSSFALLGTGLLGAAGMLKRRYQ